MSYYGDSCTLLWVVVRWHSRVENPLCNDFGVTCSLTSVRHLGALSSVLAFLVRYEPGLLTMRDGVLHEVASGCALLTFWSRLCTMVVANA